MTYIWDSAHLNLRFVVQLGVGFLRQRLQWMRNLAYVYWVNKIIDPQWLWGVLLEVYFVGHLLLKTCPNTIRVKVEHWKSMQNIAFSWFDFLNFFEWLKHFGVLSLVQFGYLLESINLLIVLCVLVGNAVIIFLLLIDPNPDLLLLLICGFQIGKNKNHVLYHL